MRETMSTKKAWLKLASVFRRDFNASKCKTWARMTSARIKLLRNKRQSLLQPMRRDVALLLQSRQDATARIRVEHVIREQNMMAANEILELFCERLVTRLSIIASQRECPTDLKEAISSLIFAAPRCSDIPELLAIRDIFRKKYGKDFVSAATDLRPDSGVNRLLVEKLSALNPSGELKLKVMKEIAKEYQIEWDTTETEAELLKPQEDRLEGPRTFVSAASLPLNVGTAAAAPPNTDVHKPTTRLSANGTEMNFQDAASAAKAAADSARDAVAAAKAAARLSQNETYYRSQSVGAANNYSLNGSSDDSDFDEESDMEQPTDGMHRAVDSTNSQTGASPFLRSKLPDHDAIAARFEELKYRKT
ncbi:hypothetical protein RND81_11G081000 [Saponaria officinalis]|uniref:IST1-like protein n=1 Tax=Saponaria officinalis TaxID=3572 RepID=A0AAW1HJD1_SAPOF